MTADDKQLIKNTDNDRHCLVHNFAPTFEIIRPNTVCPASWRSSNNAEVPVCFRTPSATPPRRPPPSSWSFNLGVTCPRLHPPVSRRRTRKAPPRGALRRPLDVHVTATAVRALSAPSGGSRGHVTRVKGTVFRGIDALTPSATAEMNASVSIGRDRSRRRHEKRGILTAEHDRGRGAHHAEEGAVDRMFLVDCHCVSSGSIFRSWPV